MQLALKAGSIAYLIPDHLGTPRVAKNASGALVWQWESDAFGNGAANEDPSGLGNFVVSLRFPGQVYDPETGRYRSSDPIGLVGGLNTYLYANGRSTVDVDAAGEVGLPGAVVGGVAGVVVSGVVAFAGGEDFSKWQTWANIGISGVAGAVAGASGAYFVPATASIGQTTLKNALIGGAVNVTAGIASNAINCKPLTEGLVVNFGIGAIFGAGGSWLEKRAVTSGIVPQAVANVDNIKSPYTGGGAVKGWAVFPNDNVINQYRAAGAGLGNGFSNAAGLFPMTIDAFNKYQESRE